MTKTALTLSLLLTFGVCTPLLADTPLDLHHPASPSAHIEISNVKGKVSISTWDRPEVHVSGNLGDGAQPLAIEGSPNNLSIKVQAPGQSGWFNWHGDQSMGETELQVQIPRGASVDVGVVSAPLTIDGIDGGDISVNSVSGRVRIDARTPQLSIISVSGNIAFAGQAQHAKLQTVSGDILAPAIQHSADVQTVSGHIQVGGGPWQTFTLSSVSGDAQINGGVAAGGHMQLNSMSGDLQLQVPADLSSHIHAKTFSGDLRSDFGTPEHPEHGPGSTLDVQAGSGQGSIEAETFSGDLRIRKQGE